jgi:arsenate reductase
VNVLFLCTGNSCRSILAEAVFNHLAPEGWRAMSAGSHPAGFVHPRALALLRSEGVSAEGLSSKSWTGLSTVPDAVVTVCDNAAAETCPVYLGEAVRAHWGVRDPARATGSDPEIEAVFRSVYRILRCRIEAFLDRLPELPELDPVRFRLALKEELDRAGGLLPEGMDKDREGMPSGR